MQYPSEPGFKEQGGTSDEQAAEHMLTSGQANILRIRVLEYMRGRRALGSTADECAHAIGESVLAVRPRFTELQQMGRLRKTKMTAKNESGRPAAVYIWEGMYANPR